mmetsp:Transcript_12565/g.11174  ORF Transcript_12565/g.11174 Transcript_12565/m.11174 type:complete len:583 (+) Transcript_12565:295-2043(+)
MEQTKSGKVKFCHKLCGRPVALDSKFKTCCKSCALHHGSPEQHTSNCEVRYHKYKENNKDKKIPPNTLKADDTKSNDHDESDNLPKWKCYLCTWENKRDDVKCYMCNKPKRNNKRKFDEFISIDRDNEVRLSCPESNSPSHHCSIKCVERWSANQNEPPAKKQKINQNNKEALAAKKTKIKSKKISIKKETFIKTSKAKKDHYLKFPTLADYSTPTSSKNAQNTTKLTNEILSKPPSGDPTQRDTLLHILNGVAQANGKKCVFFDSSKNIKSDLTQNSYLNAVDANDKEAAKFVVTLNNLDQFVDEQKYDKADKLVELKEALSNDEDNPVINDIRNKLATAHGVSSNRIIINDIYLNGVGVAYRVTDLTDSEKNKIITESKAMQGKMRKLFNDYNRCAIHPALFEQSYDISMFDERGNKTFDESENSTYKVGPPGKEKEYKQPAGWTRYGLKVLGKYGDDKWLHPFQDPGNWYRAYHATSREAGASIIQSGFRVGRNNAYGVGIYCTPDINMAAAYCRQRIKLQTKNGPKEFYYVLQVAVNPATVNNPALIPNFNASCENAKLWIAPSGADIRPYGILIKEV